MNEDISIDEINDKLEKKVQEEESYPCLEEEENYKELDFEIN